MQPEHEEQFEDYFEEESYPAYELREKRKRLSAPQRTATEEIVAWAAIGIVGVLMTIVAGIVGTETHESWVLVLHAADLADLPKLIFPKILLQ